MFENIDKTAAAFLKAGVKEKEIVTIALPNIPEALYCVYALNRIGAVANMIHPLAGKDETLFYFNEVQSRIAVIYDGAYAAIADDIGKSSVEKVIVTSPADSLPIALKIAYKLKVKAPDLDGKVFQSWRSFIRVGGAADQPINLAIAFGSVPDIRLQISRQKVERRPDPRDVLQSNQIGRDIQKFQLQLCGRRGARRAQLGQQRRRAPIHKLGAVRDGQALVMCVSRHIGGAIGRIIVKIFLHTLTPLSFAV